MNSLKSLLWLPIQSFSEPLAVKIPCAQLGPSCELLLSLLALFVIELAASECVK